MLLFTSRNFFKNYIGILGGKGNIIKHSLKITHSLVGILINFVCVSFLFSSGFEELFFKFKIFEMKELKKMIMEMMLMIMIKYWIKYEIKSEI